MEVYLPLNSCRPVRIFGAFACFVQRWWLIICILYTQQIFVGRLSNIYHIETGINKYLTQREVSQLKSFYQRFRCTYELRFS